MLSYAKYIGSTNNETLLTHPHHIISVRTLKILCKKLCPFWRENNTDLEEAASLVEEGLFSHSQLDQAGSICYSKGFCS